ncbi:hypothetical protein HY642_00255 [Candidatus Woesearchaeota archaeon]|nr:hypothetical protein [Candidatus Woesearchaeota archaeon]
MEAVTVHMHKDIEDIKTQLALIRHILEEREELSDDAKAALASARKTPRAEFISHDEVKRRLLG